jgi:hypothetical protein
MFEDDHYKEAEVVAKDLARRAYDDALHAAIDPSSLEKGAGNQFYGRYSSYLPAFTRVRSPCGRRTAPIAVSGGSAPPVLHVPHRLAQ